MLRLVKAYENWSDQIVTAAILKCSKKKLFINFNGNMRVRDHSYPVAQLAAWNVTVEKLHQRYFPVTCLKLLANPILPVEQLR